MAMPQGVHEEAGYEQDSMLKRTAGLFELFVGSTSIAPGNMDWMLSGPMSSSIRAVVSSMQEEEPPDAVDDTTGTAFARLMDVVRVPGVDEAAG